MHIDTDNLQGGNLTFCNNKLNVIYAIKFDQEKDFMWKMKKKYNTLTLEKQVSDFLLIDFILSPPDLRVFLS